MCEGAGRVGADAGPGLPLLWGHCRLPLVLAGTSCTRTACTWIVLPAFGRLYRLAHQTTWAAACVPPQPHLYWSALMTTVGRRMTRPRPLASASTCAASWACMADVWKRNEWDGEDGAS